MSDRSSDSNWFPQPPPKPLKAPSAAKLFFGMLIPIVAVVGAARAMSGFGRSGHKAKPTAAAALTVAAGVAEQDRRQAFATCMKSMGAGSSSRGGGRFGGGGPSSTYRDAFDFCRSLLRPDQVESESPQRTRTTAPPVA
jgi:uncharacterized membrane protein YgcG